VGDPFGGAGPFHPGEQNQNPNAGYAIELPGLVVSIVRGSASVRIRCSVRWS
jgi:hypothetical protein